jgi:hypothetical protein
LKNAVDIAELLKWRSQRAEENAPPPPDGARLLRLVEPWWEKWPDRFAASVRRLASIRPGYGYAMSHPHQGHSGHPIATLITNDDEEQEAPARVLYISVRGGRLRLRFHLAPVPRNDPSFEVTFVSESGLRPILSTYADSSGDDEYRVDVELPSDVAAAWESLKVTDPMPFRFILRPTSPPN